MHVNWKHELLLREKRNSGVLTFTETCVALESALAAHRIDSKTVITVLSLFPDGSPGWLRSAYVELRKNLVHGSLNEACLLGDMISCVREISEVAFVETEQQFVEPGRQKETLQDLIRGITSVCTYPARPSAPQELFNVSDCPSCDESLRWVAWIWMGIAAATTGDLNAAKIAADTAMTLSGKLDSHAKGTSQLIRAGVEYLKGEVDLVKERLRAAIAYFEECNEKREISAAWLAMSCFSDCVVHSVRKTITPLKLKFLP